jgi:hypothetical protein
MLEKLKNDGLVDALVFYKPRMEFPHDVMRRLVSSSLNPSEIGADRSLFIYF